MLMITSAIEQLNLIMTDVTVTRTLPHQFVKSCIKTIVRQTFS